MKFTFETEYNHKALTVMAKALLHITEMQKGFVQAENASAGYCDFCHKNIAYFLPVWYNTIAK